MARSMEADPSLRAVLEWIFRSRHSRSYMNETIDTFKRLSIRFCRSPWEDAARKSHQKTAIIANIDPFCGDDKLNDNVNRNLSN